MNATETDSRHVTQPRAGFQPTIWNEVRMVSHENFGLRAAALERLATAYWPPVYAYLRYWGQSNEEARDLAQGFFAYLLEKRLLELADPKKGRFRSFLLGSLKNFVSNETQRQQCLKRGGGAANLSLDALSEDHRIDMEPKETRTPDKLFERKWALEILHQGFRQLEADYQRAGMSQFFNILSPYLSQFREIPYPALAAQLHKTEGAVRTAVNRLRARYREIIRSVIAQTVGDPAQVEEEIQHFKTVLRGD